MFSVVGQKAFCQASEYILSSEQKKSMPNRHTVGDEQDKWDWRRLGQSSFFGELRKALQRHKQRMKRIEVVAAVITDGYTYLATQRKGGDWDGYWEFPGGKIEAGETPQEALVREIHEELDVFITVGDKLCTVEYDYPTFHLTMHCYLCTLSEGAPKLSEHKAIRRLKGSELSSLTWLPADVEVVAYLQAHEETLQ